MIGKLRGRVDHIGTDGAVIDVGGVGYEVFCSTRTVAALPPVGGPIDLVIETHVREDHIHLYAFTSHRERDVFRILMTVQGVGAKVALGIMSALSADQIAQAIAAQDQNAFKRASGVGPKLAARIVQELKGKLLAFDIPLRPTAVAVATKEKINGTPAKSPAEDAVSALVNLGYGRSEAYGAVARAIQADQGASIATLIRQSLRELAGSDG
ncbi:MAG: Holliday junction branch migration protein RuvA [Rhodospirillaceae bacterium]|nr:Holliday junction branch migration protein RuvA [Rhodospirillaceae bacterium]